MKRIGLVLLVALMAAGTPGCMGSDDYMDECSDYFCGVLCETSVDCGLFSPAESDSCKSVCAAKAPGKDDMRCQEIYRPATFMSCDELATFLGVPRGMSRPR